MKVRNCQELSGIVGNCQELSEMKVRNCQELSGIVTRDSQELALSGMV